MLNTIETQFYFQDTCYIISNFLRRSFEGNLARYDEKSNNFWNLSYTLLILVHFCCFFSLRMRKEGAIRTIEPNIWKDSDKRDGTWSEFSKQKLFFLDLYRSVYECPCHASFTNKFFLVSIYFLIYSLLYTTSNYF